MMTKQSSKDSVKSLIAIAKKNDKTLLKALGFEDDDVDIDCIQRTCPIHKGDNPNAFSYSLAKGVWSCFTNHCEEKYGNDIVGLVRAINQWGFKEAIQWIASVLKGSNVDTNFTINSDEVKQDLISSLPPANLIIDESKLDSLLPNYAYMLNRGYAISTIQHFQAGMCPTNNPAHKRFMLPVRNFEGKLIGFTGRSIFEECRQCGLFHNKRDACPKKYAGLFCKWRNYGFKKATELYNVEKAKEYISNDNCCILCEGPLDVWSLWEKGYKNVVAAFGTSLSFDQMCLLARAGCVYLKILLDGDKAGKKAAEKISSQAIRYFNINLINIEDDLDPASLSKEQLEHYLK